MQNISINSLFDINKTIAKDLFVAKTHPWEILPDIGEFILKLGKTLDSEIYKSLGDGVWVAKDACVFDSAYIKGPCIIDSGAEIRHCAFIRGNVIVGKNAVVGNSTEIKNSILFDCVQAPHYNYVGDSILGYKSHMGAGSITSNVKSDKTNVVIKGKDYKIETHLKKVGAMIGDGVEIGCGSVLNPGTVIGKNSNIYPLSSVRGVVEEDNIYKTKGEIVKKVNNN